MTSLALAAHDGTTAAPAFNGLFYATCATVMPVLFLAIAVQGTAYQSALKTLDAVMRLPAFQSGSGIRSPIASTALVALTAMITIFLGIMGIIAYAEIQAIYALYQGHASGITALEVLQATIFLILATAASPVAAFVGTLASAFRRALQADRASRARRQEASPHAGAGPTQETENVSPPQNPAEPEPGKTDAV
jgi:hypothetical protein